MVEVKTPCMAGVKTPCIGVCSTGLGDSVCRGCKRYAHEVIQWNAYKVDERRAILKRIDSHLATVVAERIEVFDGLRLAHELRQRNLAYQPQTPPHALVYLALRSFGARLPNLEVIGCRAKGEWADLPIAQLKERLELTFYELSCAHYQRYFPGCL